MRHGRLSRINGTVLLALLAVPFTSLAQEQAQGHAKKHTRYTLVDIGTLGGPTSDVNGGSPIANRNGVSWGCRTPLTTIRRATAISSTRFGGTNGVLTDLGTLPGGSQQHRRCDQLERARSSGFLRMA